ncbi:MAG: quinoprotein dehydrogenase-associated putative ABC transporter substrate-binding protein [Acidobacteriaceae bacterium]|nr:quinoprotein dehydrogenase-associated putative ABC transporter substrate-binding protein [Acidobacteriaceae bacterium]
MFFRSLSVFFFAIASALAADQPLLRVCADPNNLPFSNQQRQGFENKLAELFAAQLGAHLEYTWFAERKSFLKNSLDAGQCDLVVGVPGSLTSVDTTKPYYRSTYVFVARHDRNLGITSLNDPRLTDMKIGIHVVGDDYAPPAAALARRGITKNITGFSLFGEYGEANPPRKLIDAVARGDIDIAIAWGPFAGYFAREQSVPLDITPVSPAMFLAVPFTYDIAAAVRKGNTALKVQLDSVIAANSAAIHEILSDYAVPQVP